MTIGIPLSTLTVHTSARLKLLAIFEPISTMDTRGGPELEICKEHEFNESSRLLILYL